MGRRFGFTMTLANAHRRRMSPDEKTRSVSLLAAAEVLALALWFSATAVVPALRAEGLIGPDRAALFTSAVAVGFVAGTLASALMALPDRVSPKLLFSVSALVAAAANAAILLLEPGSDAVILCRFVTGACMAGVYPVGMKMAASWAKGDMGFLVGLLVGALTLGSALPHLFNALGGVDWRLTISAASVAAAIAAFLVLFVTLGPNQVPAPPFRPGAVLTAWRDRALRLANFGYFGHMWELYAMWGWLGVYLGHSFRDAGIAAAGTWAAMVTFATVAAGALGSLIGGLIADRFGRTTLTMGAMATSGACAIVIGFLYGGAPWVMAMLCIVWGISIVADSAQFSSCVIELAPAGLAGTMLTAQTCVGFTLTLLTIHLVPVMADAVGWRWSFAFLCVGPFLGVVAMARLRAHSDAVKLAHGRR